MAKYLSQGRYTQEGLKGLIKDGGTSRRDAIAKLYESVGGKLESFYYAFGATDIFVIGEVPDNVTAAAMSLIVNAAGAASVTVTPLLTPEEVDQAVKKTASYRAPGQ